MKKLTIVCLYPDYMGQKYLMSGYVLKAYLDQYFKETNELEVECLHLSNSIEPSEIARQICDKKPDFVGYSCYIWNMDVILDVCKILEGKLDATVIYGGAEMSEITAEQHISNKNAEYCIVGEGERKLAGLMDYLLYKGNGKVQTVPNGIGYLDNGEFQYTEDFETIVDLDEIPSPYLTGVVDESIYDTKMLFWESQRGCRNRCKYCVYNRNFNRISYYSLERVYAELDLFIKEKQVYSIWIIDAVITSNLERGKKIIQHIIDLKEQGYRIPTLFTEFSYNSVDDEFIGLLAKLKTRPVIHNTIDLLAIDRAQHYNELSLGYNTVNNIGIQSFTDEVCKAVSRAPVIRPKFEEFMKSCNKYNILLKIDLIFGLPLETVSSYFESISYLLSFMKGTDHIINIHRLEMLPGSALEDCAEKYGLEYLHEGSRVVISTPQMSAEEINYTSILSGILFRVANSPLRPEMFEAFERSGKGIQEFLEDIYYAAKAEERFKNTRLVTEEAIDDVYFNVDLFKDLPSKWLKAYFKNYAVEECYTL